MFARLGTGSSSACAVSASERFGGRPSRFVDLLAVSCSSSPWPGTVVPESGLRFPVRASVMEILSGCDACTLGCFCSIGAGSAVQPLIRSHLWSGSKRDLDCATLQLEHRPSGNTASVAREPQAKARPPGFLAHQCPWAGSQNDDTCVDELRIDPTERSVVDLAPTQA